MALARMRSFERTRRLRGSPRSKLVPPTTGSSSACLETLPTRTTYATESRTTIEKLGTDDDGTWRMQTKGQERQAQRTTRRNPTKPWNSSPFPSPIITWTWQTNQKVKSLWDKLETLSKAQNSARRLLLRQLLNSFMKDRTESVTSYVARAKSIISDLEGIGAKPEAEEVMLPSMAGLPEAYNVLITSVGTSKEKNTLGDILLMLLQQEQHHSVQQDSVSLKPIYSYAMSSRLSLSSTKTLPVKVQPA